jgi:hypothetical protein
MSNFGSKVHFPLRFPLTLYGFLCIRRCLVNTTPSSNIVHFLVKIKIKKKMRVHIGIEKVILKSENVLFCIDFFT